MKLTLIMIAAFAFVARIAKPRDEMSVTATNRRHRRNRADLRRALGRQP